MLLDAYAVRKAIPRIVLAVIGINLSIYLCVAAVDIINVLAQGMASLITGPFVDAGTTVFEVKTTPENAIAAGAGIAVGAGPMVSAVTGAFGVITGGVGAISGALSALLFLLIPIALLALAIVCTVVIRQALLFFLIVISPVAIACYILPGTEKYFQKWGDLFLKTLMVYPIIAIMFALSDVFASIIFSTNSGGLQGIAKIITGIVVIYAPLFLIPFAFRFAGGALSAIARVASGVGDKAAQSGFVKSRQEHYGQVNKDNINRYKAEQYRKATQRANTQGRFGRVSGWQAKKLSGYKTDILDREAEINKRLGEQVAATTNYGDDALIRAYSVNKGVSQERVNADGSKEFLTAGGKWIDEASVDLAKRKYGDRNVSMLQQSLAYEEKKAITQDQQDNLVKSFAETADAWGMSGNEANGVWIGAGFANQDKNRQWKHGRWDNSDGKFQMKAGGNNLIQEFDENIGSYQASQSNADTFTTMSAEVKRAAATKQSAQREIDDLNKVPIAQRSPDFQAQIDTHQAKVNESDATLKRAARIVNSIRTVQQERDSEGKPIPGGKTFEVIGSGAAGRTQEEMRAFAKITDEAYGKYTDQNANVADEDVVQLPPGNVEDALDERTNERRNPQG